MEGAISTNNNAEAAAVVTSTMGRRKRYNSFQLHWNRIKDIFTFPSPDTAQMNSTRPNFRPTCCISSSSNPSGICQALAWTRTRRFFCLRDLTAKEVAINSFCSATDITTTTVYGGHGAVGCSNINNSNAIWQTPNFMETPRLPQSSVERPQPG